AGRSRKSRQRRHPAREGLSKPDRSGVYLRTSAQQEARPLYLGRRNAGLFSRRAGADPLSTELVVPSSAEFAAAGSAAGAEIGRRSGLEEQTAGQQAQERAGWARREMIADPKPGDTGAQQHACQNQSDDPQGHPKIGTR